MAVRILLVDDDDVDRLAVRRHLANAPFEAALIEAVDGRSALRQIRCEPFDCILLDYQLPDCDGAAVLREVAPTRVENPPVVMLTGCGDENLAVELMKLGASDYIPKSDLSASRLFAAVRSAVALCEEQRRLDRARQQLRQSEALFRAIFEQAAVGIAQLSPEGRILGVNQRLCEILDHREDELLGSLLPDLSQSTDLGEWLRSGLGGRFSPGALEARLRKREGVLVWVGIAVSCVRSETGSANFVAVVEDIDARKRAEEGLQMASRDLERSNRELEEFAYAISHDLQEPLRTVAGFVDLLEEHLRSHHDAEAERLMHFVGKGARRMRQMIDDLLQYSRVGCTEVPPAPVPSDETLDEALENLKRMIDEAGAEIQIDSLPPVRGEPSLLVQVFQNLIQNAIKYRGEEPVRIQVSAATWGTFHRFAVRDNGIGFDRAHRERIFRIFQQLQPRSRATGTGLGLGLALVRRIVERHGGRVWAESQPGRGSTFYFTLPAADPAEDKEFGSRSRSNSRIE